MLKCNVTCCMQSTKLTAIFCVLQHHAEHPGGGVRPPGEAQGRGAHGTSNAGKPMTSCASSLSVWIFFMSVRLSKLLSIQPLDLARFCPFVHSISHPLIRSVICSFNCPSVRPSIQPFMCSFLNVFLPRQSGAGRRTFNQFIHSVIEHTSAHTVRSTEVSTAFFGACNCPTKCLDRKMHVVLHVLRHLLFEDSLQTLCSLRSANMQLLSDA